MENIDVVRKVRAEKFNSQEAHHMHHNKPDCLGNYDFEHIAFYAKKRFVDGFDTVALIAQAKSDRAREEIALVSLLDVKDDEILDIELSCRYARTCKILDCRDRLRKLIKLKLTDSAVANHF